MRFSFTESEEQENEEEPIDEEDPLWKATLRLCEGDRARAVKLLEDPDALMQYPEIRAIMEGAEGDEDTAAPAAPEEWESTPVETASAEEPEPVITKETATPAKASSASAAAVEEEASSPLPPAAIVEDATLVEGDPRDHLNLVFIGHVDAGKSTLSGSILYTMGKVDKRTIERFEKEAKDRNRESWFLAFILDTSEEERAKGKTVEVGRAHFDTEKNRYTILDAPGHKNYVPNMV